MLVSKSFHMSVKVNSIRLLDLWSFSPTNSRYASKFCLFICFCMKILYVSRSKTSEVQIKRFMMLKSMFTENLLQSMLV